MGDRVGDGITVNPDRHFEANHSTMADQLQAEIERLRGVLHQHYCFVHFVHLWVNRDGVTDDVRVSAIKHHPSLRKWMGEEASNDQQGDKDSQLK